MAMKADSSVIRSMKADIQKTEGRIGDAMEVISNINAHTSGWDDELGAQFRGVLREIASSCEKPKTSLHDAQPKLEKLAALVDKYSQMKF